MSPMVVSGGATPFITNRQRPKGGDFIPISRLMRTNSPNHIKLNPNTSTMGKNMGKVIIIMETTSMKQPRIRMRNCIMRRSAMGGRLRPATISVKPRVAPLKAKIWLKAVEPVRIINIMTVMRRVPATDFFTRLKFSFP